MICCQVVGILRVTVVVVVFCLRRAVELEWEDNAVVTVEAVVVSFGVPGGRMESIKSAGENLGGVVRQELRRSVTLLRAVCEMLSMVRWDVVLLMILEVERPGAERVFPRETREGALSLAADHSSLRVRGARAFLMECGGLVLGGGSEASMSIASSSDGRGGGLRSGEAEISSALRVCGGLDGEDTTGRVVSEDIVMTMGRIGSTGDLNGVEI